MLLFFYGLVIGTFIGGAVAIASFYLKNKKIFENKGEEENDYYKQ